jgi:hypothetical protein
LLVKILDRLSFYLLTHVVDDVLALVFHHIETSIMMMFHHALHHGDTRISSWAH